MNHFSKNPLRKFELGKVTADKQGRPTMPYVITLADGSRLEGTAVFEYEPVTQEWWAVRCFDWHLKK